MVTLNIGNPGFFDTAMNRLNTQNLQNRYGVGNHAFLDYAARANEARGIGLAGQADAMGMYRQGALGQAPSAAQAMWRQQADRNMTDALTIGARGRGGNIAGMQQQALGAQQYGALQTNQQMAALRAQEQQAALAGYAGMANQVAGQGLGYDQLASNTQLGADRNALGWYSAERGMDMQQAQQSWDRFKDTMGMAKDWSQMIAGAAGGAIGGGLMSDERSKQDIRPTSLAASQAVGDVTPIQYAYRPGMGPHGQQIGVSAQDLESSPMTSQLVQEGPDGLKRVDIGGMAAMGLAASAEQEGRLRRLEQQAGVDPFAGSQYQPDANIDFGSRMAAGRQRTPFGVPQRTGMSTINPFDEARGSSGLTQLLSDERAKRSVRPTMGGY